MKIKVDVYSVVLHVALAALCIVTVLLALENQRLRAQFTPVDAGPEIGQSLQPIRLLPLDGGETTLDLAGAGRDSLIFVFTTDCPACKKTQASWRSLHRDLGDRVDVVGISLSDLDETRAYRKRQELPFLVGVPAELQRLTEELVISGVPLTIRVGPDGRVRGSWSGVLSADQLSEVARTDHG